jgi:hypothetical protein
VTEPGTGHPDVPRRFLRFGSPYPPLGRAVAALVTAPLRFDAAPASGNCRLRMHRGDGFADVGAKRAGSLERFNFGEIQFQQC